ncbi:gamma-glutamyl hydrolase [Cyclospora cayetanensis]|nr:gamma-glutamyl hydrolase [Cyclospora cayetanensis]
MSAIVAAEAGEAPRISPFTDGEAASDDASGFGHRPAPVIGVLLQPVDENLPLEVAGVSREKLAAGNTSYVAASYFKYIESAGCVALPIDLEWSEQEHRTIFGQINGLLLPGGSADISRWDAPYIRIARLYYDMALESNASGRFFPIVGICLGYEALVVVASGNVGYFSQQTEDDLDRRRVLTFTPEASASVLFGSGSFPASKNSEQQNSIQRSVGVLKSPEDRRGPLRNRAMEGSMEDEGKTDEGSDELLGHIDPQQEEHDLAALRSSFSVKAVRHLLASHPIAYFHHYRNLSVKEFRQDDKLQREWLLTATAKLPRESTAEIVAAIEHKQFPFYGFQFHPEKALYEHCPKSRIPHFFSALLPSLYISAFLGLIARHSRNEFKDQRERFDKIEFAFTPTRTAVYGQIYSFEQAYIFPSGVKKDIRERLQTFLEAQSKQMGELQGHQQNTSTLMASIHEA